MRKFFPITCIVLAASAFSIASIVPKSHYDVTLQSYLDHYKGVKVTFTPVHDTWIQGQEVFLNYHVECGPPRKYPFSDSHYSYDLNLFCNGQPVPKEVFGPFSHFVPSGEVQSSFEGKYVLSVGFGQNETKDSLGFRHLLPGHYEGYFDYGYLSPVFEFDVLSVPDSSESEWQDYLWIRASRFRYPTDKSKALLDSTLLLAPRLISCPWNVEGLSSAFTICGRNREIWTDDDSVSIQDLLVNFAAIDDAPPGYVLVSVLKTVLANVPESEQADSLDDWCRNYGNQRLLEASVKYRKSIEEHKRTR